ncbi:MAG: Clp1/GlmU family protein [Candidatus Bathyarchaeia archaeon]
MNVKIKLPAGKSMLVDGPASITFEEGEAQVLGAPVRRREKLLVKDGVRLPLDSIKNCDLTLNIMDERQLIIVESKAIPSSWIDVAAELVKRNLEKVMVLGAVDAGKSSLCTYLSNIFFEKMGKAYILDLDLGQSNLGPPTTLGLGEVRSYIKSLGEACTLALYFVGSNTPHNALNKVFRGVVKLTTVGLTAPLIINTDGWISDELAVSYKLRLIELIKPKALVALGEEANKLLTASEVTAFKAQTPPYVLRRSREDRRIIRERRFYEYLKNGRPRFFNLKSLTYEGLRDEKESLRSLVGLLNSEGWLLGIGVVKELSLKKCYVKVHTNFDGKVHRIEEGDVKLDDQGREIPPNQ